MSSGSSAFLGSLAPPTQTGITVTSRLSAVATSDRTQSWGYINAPLSQIIYYGEPVRADQRKKDPALRQSLFNDFCELPSSIRINIHENVFAAKIVRQILANAERVRCTVFAPIADEYFHHPVLVGPILSQKSHNRELYLSVVPPWMEWWAGGRGHGSQPRTAACLRMDRMAEWRLVCRCVVLGDLYVGYPDDDARGLVH